MIPAGITTATVHLDAPVSFTGDPGRLHVTIAPSVSLIWTATGTPMGSFTDTFSPSPGAELSVQLPHTDQPGFEDGFGNAYTGWYYTATVVYEKDGHRINFPDRDFQLPTGQTEVDLALVPAGEAAPVPQIAPILPVTSLAGLTGEVTVAELDTILSAQPAVTSKVNKVDLSNGGNTLNTRALSADVPTFDSNFVFSKISTNQDGWIAVKDLTVSGGFGGQVGQGGAISYFKAVGIAAHHSGIGNYDHFWGSLYHDGTREAGMFIGDITGRRGGNVYGGHFRVQSDTTPPPYLVGLSLEVIPNVAKGVQTNATLAAGISAGVATTSITLSAPVQLTTGTNLEFTAGNGTKVVAYVSTTMAAASATVPVTSFSTSSAIASGTTVVVGVNSTYLGLEVSNNGSQSASAAISVTGPGSAQTPFVFGLNFDASAADVGGTAIMVGGAWGAGINMNNNNIVGAATVAGNGSSPNREVRIADHLVLDNSRYIKMKNAAGTAKGVARVTSSDNLRLVLPGAANQFEFTNTDESATIARITASGRGDFTVGGVTTKASTGTSPSYITDGQLEVWRDTAAGLDYLVVGANGVSKRVGIDNPEIKSPNGTRWRITVGDDGALTTTAL